MFRLLSLVIFSFFPSFTFALTNLSEIKWINLEDEEKIVLIQELRVHLRKLEKLSPNPDQVSFNFTLNILKEAHANPEKICFIGGWPSEIKNGSCQTPAQSNPAYQYYEACSDGELLCNPALFGVGLCADFRTKEDKNSVYRQCEELFELEDRNYFDILDHAGEKEFKDLFSKVDQNCNQEQSKSIRSPLCYKLKERLRYFIPDETPRHLDKLNNAIESAKGQEALKASESLEDELQKDFQDFEENCTPDIPPHKGVYCKNLSIRVSKATKAISLAIDQIDQMECDEADVLLSPEQMGVLPEELNCTDEEKKIRPTQCLKDVGCSIASTLVLAVAAVSEITNKTPHACVSTQNDCLTNVISSIVRSLITLVTGIWDLLGMAKDWAKGKLGEFWSWVTEVEDKTSDAQHVMNQMSDEDLNQVKTSPLEWIQKVASGLWEGITHWAKSDVFCEKWSGLPRASECVEPMKNFDCLSCRTKIAGTCSAFGVVAAEVVPAFLTGGAVNIAGRGAKAGSAVAKIIQGTKSYKKIAQSVDALNEIKVIQKLKTGATLAKQTLKTTSRPMRAVIKLGIQKLSKRHGEFIKSERYLKAMSKLETAARYTGLKAFGDLQVKMYKLGYSSVDTLAARIGKKTNRLSSSAQKILKAEKVRKAIEQLDDDYIAADMLGDEILKLEEELKKFLPNIPADKKTEATEIYKKVAALKAEQIKKTDNYVKTLHEIYKTDGVKSTIKKSSEGNLFLELDLTKNSENKRVIKVFNQMQKKFGIKKITIDPLNNVRMGSGGFFSSTNSQIDLGHFQGTDILKDIIHPFSRHEGRHGMFYAKRNRKEDSIFHLKFIASKNGKHLLNQSNIYDEYMSAEELYTFSTDMQSFARTFNKASDTKKYDLNRIIDRNHYLNTVAENARKNSKEMLKVIDEIIDAKDVSKLSIVKEKNGNVSVEIFDELERSVRVHLLKPEYSAMADKFNKLQKQYELEKVIYLRKNNFYGSKASPEYAKLNRKFADQESVKELRKKMIKTIRPGLDEASIKLNKMKKLARIQADAATDLDIFIDKNMAKIEAADPIVIKELQERISKISLNVKENYKGFALNNPDIVP